MHGVQYIKVSIIIIVNLFLKLIFDCYLCLYQSPDCFKGIV